MMRLISTEMKVVFTNNIVSVTVVEKSRHHAYLSGCDFKSKLRCVRYKWGFIPVEFKNVEGFYGVFSGEFRGTMDDYIRRHEVYFENGELYTKPFCKVSMCDGSYEYLYFDTVDELRDYVENLKKLGDHILID